MKKSIVSTLVFLLASVSSVLADDFSVVSTDSTNPDKFEPGSDWSVKGTYNFINASDGKVDVYATTPRRYSSSSIWIDDNVHVTFSISNAQLWKSFTLGEGASIFSKSALRLQGSSTTAYDVYGDMTITGKQAKSSLDKASDAYAFYLQSGVLNLHEDASLTQTGVHDVATSILRATNKIGGTLNVYTSNALKFDDYVYFMEKANLNLHTTTNIISGAAVGSYPNNADLGLTDATSQKDSTFFVRNIVNNDSGAGALTINAFVENEFGTINAYQGSNITLVTNEISEGSLVINNINVYNDSYSSAEDGLDSDIKDDLTLTLSFMLAERTDSLRITNITELLDNANVSIKIYDDEKGEYVDGVLGENYFIFDGGYISSIPEPAEWAMIFGALALSFVAYRRRK